MFSYYKSIRNKSFLEKRKYDNSNENLSGSEKFKQKKDFLKNDGFFETKKKIKNCLDNNFEIENELFTEWTLLNKKFKWSLSKIKIDFLSELLLNSDNINKEIIKRLLKNKLIEIDNSIWLINRYKEILKWNLDYKINDSYSSFFESDKEELIILNQIENINTKVNETFIDEYIENEFFNKKDWNQENDTSINYMIKSANTDIFKLEIIYDLRKINWLFKEWFHNEIYHFIIDKFYNNSSKISEKDMNLLWFFIFLPDEIRHIYQGFFSFKIYEDFLNKQKNLNKEEKHILIEYLRLHFITKKDLVKELKLDTNKTIDFLNKKIQYHEYEEKLVIKWEKKLKEYYDFLKIFWNVFKNASTESWLNKFAWFMTDIWHWTNPMTNLTGMEFSILLDKVTENRINEVNNSKLFILEDDLNQWDIWKKLYKINWTQEKNISYLSDYVNFKILELDNSINIFFLDINNNWDESAWIKAAFQIISKKLEDIENAKNKNDIINIIITIASDSLELINKAKIFFEEKYFSEEEVRFSWEHLTNINKKTSFEPKILLNIKCKKDVTKYL